MIFLEPSNRDLRIEYPELADIEEFKTLSQRELLFVYYYSCKASSFVHTKEKGKRVDEAINKTWGSSMPIPEYRDYTSFKFPERVQMAIERMRLFQPEVRKRAKEMVDTIFDNYEKIVTNANNELLLASPEAAKSYVDVTLKIVDALQELIKKKEEGFGFKQQRKGKDNRVVANIMDIALSQETSDVV
jgi:hypothetical protein